MEKVNNEEEIKKLRNYFVALFSDEEFKKKYLDFFLDRFVYSAAELEAKEERQIIIGRLLRSFETLRSRLDYKIGPFDIRDIADIINEPSAIEGFRRIFVVPGKFAKWEVSSPKDIILDLYNLLNNYYNVWNIRNPYEREAEFQISFMRIHPFEDGNKRVAKILLVFNLMSQGLPPVIINEEETTDYYDCINNSDVKGFSEFLARKSLEELRLIISQYKMYKNIPIETSIEEIIGRKSS